ncbi:branched-chain amino acid ABC transporter permease [Candidatus Aerophobetes bacterium]|uniref:Branched-chain amino acid ABC transporter permease n=4 Tax=root TaxID=1 RepID=A0A523YQP8_UNCAE|nr:MAG: branched-chain amino acid ABC transporter permease [Candidatus Aerophobetes bacterium]
MELLSGIPQLIVYGIISGSIITLGAIGLSLTYRILNFANFSHGDIMSLGAFLALVSLALLRGLGIPDSPFGPLSFGLPMVLAFFIALLLTALAAIIIDRILYRRLRRTGPIILLIAAVGMAFCLRNIIQFIWGPQPQYYIKAIQIARKIPLLGIRIKPDEVFIIIVVALLVIGLHFFLQKTKMGKAMRAASDNMELARVSGIDTEKVIMWTWAIAAALAAAGGILVGIEDKFITPDMGWQMLLPIFAAVILGGIGNPYGAMAGGMIIGLSGEISTAFISTAYKPAVAFIIMVIVLIIKPRGLFGTR